MTTKVPNKKNYEHWTAEDWVRNCMPNDLCITFIAVDEHKNKPVEKCGCIYCAGERV